MNEERLALRMREVARLLDLPLSSCYAAAKRGEIPTVRFGGALRVPRRALEALLEDRASRTRAHLEQRAETE